MPTKSNQEYWEEKRARIGIEELQRGTYHDKRELQKRLDEMITKGIGSTSAVMLFDSRSASSTPNARGTDAETAALKDKLAKAGAAKAAQLQE